MSEDESIQSKGGHARAKNLTAVQRSEIARDAASARWSNPTAVATHSGIIKVGPDAVDEIECANLEDGRRVISERAVLQALGRGYSGYYSQRDAKARKAAAADGTEPTSVPRYLAPGYPNGYEAI